MEEKVLRISLQILKSFVDEITFKNAKEYYEGGFVGELNFNSEKISIFKDIKINAEVISFNNFNCYEVQIDWDHLSNGFSYSCTCELDEDRINNGMCSHVAAVLLKYMYEYQNKLYITGNSNVTSDIDKLIESLKNASKDVLEYKRDLDLEIKLISGNSFEKPSLELKTGLTKNYVVKNMRKFLDAILENEALEFGKNFIFNPTLQKFKDEDEKIIDMLLELREIDDENTSNPYSYYKTPSAIFSGKKVFMPDTLLYRFMNLISDRRINASIDGKEYENVSIVRDEMPLKFNFGMNEHSIEISQMEEIPIAIDNSKRVFFYKNNFYLPPKEQVNLYVPIFNLLERKGKLFINKKEGEKVVSYLLPALKKVSHEVVLDKKVQEEFYEAELIIRAYLDKSDDFITASIKYIYDDLEIDPFKKDEIRDRNKGILIRDIKKEESCNEILESFGFEKYKDLYIMKDEGSIVSFIREGVNKLQELSEVYYSDSFKNIRLYGKSSLKAGVRLTSENLLEFTFELEGIDKEELKGIFSAVREKKKYYKLKKGGFVTLEDDGVKDLGEVIDYLGINDKELLNDKILISKYNAMYLDQKIKDKEMDYFKRSKDFRELTNNIRDVKEMDYELPDSLQKIMRNYQKTGFKWFKTLASYGFGGILADEMGLGKTLETIAFLSTEKGEKPSLVVAPTSLVYNWQEEIEKFSPDMKVLIMSGTKKQREELMGSIYKCDVVITSYPLIRRDIDEYEKINFKYCILDEAQQIKNAASINADSVKRIKAEGYFALTGTPMENSLTELWSIFDFIMPGYLMSRSKFSRIYETPIVKNDDKNALEELNKHIKPFILRRLKKDVLRELPPKIVHKLVVDMTDEQKKLYAAYLESAKDEINEEIKNKGFNKSKLKIFSILTRLRQICCDPSVFVEEFKGKSGKIIALLDILEESTGQGHKVLLFSQFTSVLKNIIEVLNKNKLDYLYLDGNTKSEERINLCREFNEGDKNIFLISLKAGGTGLNLTGADIVIHFDPWWNPAVEEQATDRAHRIGQKKTVEVIKLICKGTIEEKIFNLQEEKKKIIDNVINENKNEDNVITRLNEEDLKKLFV